MYKIKNRCGAPWAPLAAGRLARGWGISIARSKIDPISESLYATTVESNRKVVERVAEIAEKRGVTMAQIALAWLLQKKPIIFPTVGPTKMFHLEDAVDALSIKLTPEKIGLLEEPYVSHPVIGIEVTPP